MLNWKTIRETAKVRGYGLSRIPLIFAVSPTVLELTSERCEVRIPLNRITRNHLRSMYFGTLAIGADLSGGLLAVQAMGGMERGISLIFKDFHADFLKRAEGDVHFVCESGRAVAETVKLAEETGERQNTTLEIRATVPKKLGDEPVALFKLTLSLKKKARAT